MFVLTLYLTNASLSLHEDNVDIDEYICPYIERKYYYTLTSFHIIIKYINILEVQFNSLIELLATGPNTCIHISTYIHVYIFNKHIIIIVYTGINNETLFYKDIFKKSC